MKMGFEKTKKKQKKNMSSFLKCLKYWKVLELLM